MSLPRMFIASSVRALDYARAIKDELEHDAIARVWYQDTFEGGSYPLIDLIRELQRSDFVACVFFPEDKTDIGDTATLAVRDNVIFELGMAIGLIGADRCFIVIPRNQKFHIPTDLAGVIPLDFRPPEEESDLQSALGFACNQMRKRFKRATPAPPAPAAAILKPAYDREAAFKRAVEQVADKPLIRMTRYSRNDRIESSGDVLSSEHFIEVEALAEDVAELTGYFASRAGRSTDPRYCEIGEPGQSIAWQWAGSDTQAEVRRAKTVYDPPLRRGRPISYKRERRMFSVVSFTQAERLEVTGQQERDEKVSMTFGNIVDEYQLLITFPERRFPQAIAGSADAGGNRDAAESRYVTGCISPMPETRTVLLAMRKPLPGYRYTLRWDLPAESAPEFSPVQAGFVEEMTKRLLALRGVSANHFTSVKDALAAARSKVQLRAGEEALGTVIYVYDRARGGLACAATLDADAVEGIWQQYLFKPGLGIAGYAFRQKSPAGYVRPADGEEDRYEKVASEAPENKPAAMICIPLFLGAERRRSIGVLTFSTSLASSGLLKTAQNSAELQAIADDLAGWYENDLARALGIVPTTQFWMPRAI